MPLAGGSGTCRRLLGGPPACTACRTAPARPSSRKSGWQLC